MVKGALLILLALIALGLMAGPGYRRLIRKVLGWLRLDR